MTQVIEEGKVSCMNSVYEKDDDYQITVTYISSLMAGDYSFAQQVEESVDGEVFVDSLELFSSYMFNVMQEMYPNASAEEFVSALRSRDFSSLA